ncbi:MAG TPA: DUF721 domain-containing protein [Candidatus Cloacimonadota bacterium]|nr:DUF721 domain-containing protein [Candidatus Cloacimonadota bacterium]
MPISSLSDYCRDFVLKLAGEKYHNLALIALSWRDIVGDLLAERSYPRKYEHHVLFVEVSNPTWMQELILTKEDLIKRLNERLDLQVNDIIFLIGKQDGT